MKLIRKFNDHAGYYVVVNDSGVITHSTEPLDIHYVEGCGNKVGEVRVYDTIQPLDLQEVEKLISETDLFIKASIRFDEDTKKIPYPTPYWFESKNAQIQGFVKGYNQCLIDNYNKGYIEGKESSDDFIQSLQPKSEWEVEFVEGKLMLK